MWDVGMEGGRAEMRTTHEHTARTHKLCTHARTHVMAYVWPLLPPLD